MEWNSFCPPRCRKRTSSLPGHMSACASRREGGLQSVCPEGQTLRVTNHQGDANQDHGDGASHLSDWATSVNQQVRADEDVEKGTPWLLRGRKLWRCLRKLT